MNKVINFIVWPAVAGLVFGIVLLQLPRLADQIPALEAYLPIPEVQQLTQNSFSYSDAISKAAPAVVSINSTADVARKVNEVYLNQFQPRPLGIYERDESSSLGSGVIISPDGYIITSYHIFELQDPNLVPDPESPLPEIIVQLYDGRNVEARIVAVQQENDLALLKIDEDNLAYLLPVDEYTLDVGDIVLAIGNPRNIGQSVTLGIISALLRAEDSYVIQTDPAINPGSSGGALIDVDGRLIGINSTIVTESGGSEGISFAIPANKAFDMMQSYIERGPGGYLGVDGRVIASPIASAMMFGSALKGLWVERLMKNGPAEKAGVRLNDVIVSLADIKIENDDDALFAIQTITNLGPGETVVARIFRDDEYIEIPIILGVGEALFYYTQNQEFLDPEPFGDSLLR